MAQQNEQMVQLVAKSILNDLANGKEINYDEMKYLVHYLLIDENLNKQQLEDVMILIEHYKEKNDFEILDEFNYYSDLMQQWY